MNRPTRLNGRKIVPVGLLLALALGVNSQAFADCSFISGTTLPMHLTLPASLLIQRDTPPGTLIWQSGQSTPTGAVTIHCTGTTTYTEASRYLGGQPLAAGYTDVYQTALPGVGVRLRNQGTYTLWDPVPTAITYTVSGADFWTYNESKYIFFKMELIYLGGDISNKLSFASPLASLVTGSVTAGQLYVDGSTTVTKIACSLNSTSINVPLGDILTTKFTGVGVTTGDKKFDLGLTCDRGTKINVSLAGSQNADTNDTSVLALTNAGQSGTATGVGVQLLYGGTPLIINNLLPLKISNGGQETLPFTARYYQTKTTVSAGLANSSATLNITYQ